jgi:hypothetical protein
MSLLPCRRACELDACTEEQRWLTEGLWALEAVGIVGGARGSEVQIFPFLHGRQQQEPRRWQTVAAPSMQSCHSGKQRAYWQGLLQSMLHDVVFSKLEQIPSPQ